MAVGTVLLAIFTALLTAAYLWLRHTYSYWRRNKVPYVKATPVLGSLKDVLYMKRCIGEELAKNYNDPKAKGHPVVGMHILHTPALLIREPELIKRIMVKDFSKFTNRYSSPDIHRDLLGTHSLFFAKNPAWKETRVKLTPVFTSGKIKQMFPLITEIGDELDSFLKSQPIDAKTQAVELEIKEINASFSNDVIVTVAFGVKTNSFQNPKNDFRVSGQKIFEFTFGRSLEFFIIFFVPKLVSILGCKAFSKESSKFLQDSISYVIKERAKSGVVRNDLIDTFLALKKEAEIDPEKKKFATDDFLVAQAAVFFSGGFETSSSTTSFALYELCKHPEIQKQLRQEIKDTLKANDGKVTYEMIHEMKLLNAVILETLRLHPSVPLLERECTLPAGEETYSLEPFSKFSIPNGMPIYVSPIGLQRDPLYFPDPNEFKPDRFYPENKSSISPYAFMPFGNGPRNCVGERLGLVQARVGLISFLRNHYVERNPKTPMDIIYDPKSFTLQGKGGIYLNVVRDPLL